jgi:hypothetical protein
MPKRVHLAKTLSLLPIQTGIAESRSRYRLRRAGHYWRYSFSENNEIIYLKNYNRETLAAVAELRSKVKHKSYSSARKVIESLEADKSS